MMEGQEKPGPDAAYALNLADSSYAWYRKAAIRSRQWFRAGEIVVLITSATIPISAVISPRNATVPAVLGAIIVAASGLSSIFHWQDNYLRFSRAREAVEFERRQYITCSGRYAEENERNKALVAAISQIEQDEMSSWMQIASTKPDR